MAARKMKGSWWVDFRYRGDRIRKKSPLDNKRGAEEYERRLRQELMTATPKEEVPTFQEWFEGRFWREWVVGRKNKPSETEAKASIFKVHLKGAFGKKKLDTIGNGEIADFRASLVEKKLSEKRINNILAVLSKALRYAADVRLIAYAPKVGLFKVERPEIVWWELSEYSRLLSAAMAEGPMWFAAVCLAGEAGLRVGEIKALRWKEDVDLVAATVTVSRQSRRGLTGTPKGRTRRTVPMTEPLAAALRGLYQVLSAITPPSGLVVENPNGTTLSDGQVERRLHRVCRRAGLPVRGWHSLRHAFGTHAAMFGVNPWRLMTWMGHKRIEETMLYVHLAEGHRRTLPPEVIAAASKEADPDSRVLAMLGARRHVGAASGLGTRWAPEAVVEEKREELQGVM